MTKLVSQSPIKQTNGNQLCTAAKNTNSQLAPISPNDEIPNNNARHPRLAKFFLSSFIFAAVISSHPRGGSPRDSVVVGFRARNLINDSPITLLTAGVWVPKFGKKTDYRGYFFTRTHRGTDDYRELIELICARTLRGAEKFKMYDFTLNSRSTNDDDDDDAESFFVRVRGRESAPRGRRL